MIGTSLLHTLLPSARLAAMERHEFSAAALRTGAENELSLGNFTAQIGRNDSDAPDVRRIIVSTRSGYVLDLLPSKGLSVGRFKTPKGDVFWNIPVRGLVSPESFDPLAPMLVNGQVVKSLRWIENFAGAIELLGLSNWGMPVKDPDSDTILPLHGEASQIPVQTCEILADDRFFGAVASYEVRDRWWTDPEYADRPWYRRGNPLWTITRHVVLDTDKRQLQVLDAIRNDGSRRRRPDWGYHVQLRPEAGGKYVIPSRKTVGRFGGAVPEDFQVWRPAPDPTIRTERGYIHSGVEAVSDPVGGKAVQTWAEYPTLPTVRVTMPLAPYMLSWFSCGGTGGKEFDRPENPDGRYMAVGWDGFGPEFGASPLDHDGAGDPTVAEPELEPGETRLLHIAVTQE